MCVCECECVHVCVCVCVIGKTEEEKTMTPHEMFKYTHLQPDLVTTEIA